MVGPVEAVIRGFRGYIDFGGRATRAEYWWWVLFVFIGGIVFSFIGTLLGPEFLHFLFGLAVLLPTAAITTRRLHDIGRSGLWKVAWLAVGLLAGFLTYIATGDVPDDGIDSRIMSAVLDRIDWMNAETLLPFVPPTALVIAASVVATAGGAWALAWLVWRGESGPNRFGPDPKAKGTPVVRAQA